MAILPSATTTVSRGDAITPHSQCVHISGNDTIAGTKTFSSQTVSTQATGTSPLAVSSTTVNTNLNADTVDGSHASAFAASSHAHSSLDASDGSPTNALVADATGQIGIGTATPGKLLHLRKDTGSGTYVDLLILDSVNGNAGNGGGIAFYNNSAGTPLVLGRLKFIDAGAYDGKFVLQLSNASGVGDTQRDVITALGVDGSVTIPSLAGVGTRNVVVDSNGKLSAP